LRHKLTDQPFDDYNINPSSKTRHWMCDRT